MSEIDWGAARFFLGLTQWIAVIGVGVYAWWSARSRATRESLDQMLERVVTLEHEVAAAPRHRDLSQIKNDISGIRADVKGLNSTVVGHTKAVDLMMEHLLDKGREK